MKYDCTTDILAHKVRVMAIATNFINALHEAARIHDDSKLSNPVEKEAFDIYTPKLKESVYGSLEYRQNLKNMGPALLSHHQNNRHHPEHFENGIAGMSLIDITEMLSDWMAAAESGSGELDLDGLAKRFKIDPQLLSILRNTATALVDRGAAAVKVK